MRNPLIDSYRCKNNFKEYRTRKLRYSLFKKLSRNALPLFFKGGDIISIDPIANGLYEPDVKSLIEHFADNGFNDFLLDIGANIGLSSCQSGRKFKELHLFEPNPNCVSILKINANIALRGVPYNIHEFGLGSSSATLQLYVPFDNWGGAFVKSSENEYDESLLSAKDGYGTFNRDNYDVLPVQIESASRVLTDIFEKLKAQGHTRGVIKVDAEGYEKFIVNTVLAVKPQGMECAVIFENWKNQVSVADYFSNVPTQGCLFRLDNDKTLYSSAPRWFNSLMNLLRGGFSHVLKEVQGELSGGTYLLVI